MPNEPARETLRGTGTGVENEYFIRQGGRSRGPFSIEKLHDLARRGRFSRFHEVSLDGQTWRRAGEVPELFPQADPAKARKPRSAPLGAVDSAAPMGSPTAEAPETELDSFEEIAAGEEAVWYYTLQNEDQPPARLEQLLELARQGELTAYDQVWTDGMADWLPAGKVPELQHVLGTAPAADVAAEPLPLVVPVEESVLDRLPPKAAPMAVTSLVMGLLGLLCTFGSVLAVIFGHVAMKQIKDSRGQLGGRGLALTGLILGYSVIALSIVALFIFLAIGVAGNM